MRLLRSDQLGIAPGAGLGLEGRTVAELACASEDGPDPAAGRPDPGAAGWADILTAEIRAMRAAVEELARRPGDPAALEMARLNLVVAENLAALARRVTFDEQTLEAVRAQAFAEGVAACKAARCRLGVIGGG